MAFTCSLTAGYQLPTCSLSQGGVTTIYMAPWSACTYNVSADDTITAINSSALTLYTFDCVSETAEFSEKGTANIQNQSLFFEQDVTIFIPKQSAARRNQFKVMASTGMLVIVKDRQDVYHLIGKTQAAFLKEGSSGTGKAASDANGYTITLSAKEPEPSFIVSAGAFIASY